MVLKLLEIKEHLKNFYEKYGVYVRILLKLVCTFLLLTIINGEMGYSSLFNNMIIVAGLSVIAALTPDAVLFLIVTAVTIVNAYGISPVLAVVYAIIYIIIYLMFVRYETKQAYVILAIPVLYVFHIPYAVPLLCGIFLGPVSIISCIIGVVMYYMFHSVSVIAGVSDGTGIANTVNFFNMLVDDLRNNKYMVASAIIFSVVVLIVYIIRRQKIKHATDFAIIIGVMVNIISFLAASAFVKDGNSVFGILAGTVVSGIIAYIAQFFRMSLDYAGTKNIQFEDDEYYYYVKTVPKLTVAAPQMQIKRIHAQKPTGNTANIADIINNDLYDKDKE
jgi:hypothetical protein